MQNKSLFLILGLATIVRLISLNQSFWLDEATSGLVVRNLSFTELLHNFSPSDFHPPLYYLFLKAWLIVIGTSESALRMLSVFLGVGTVFLTYKIAQLISKDWLPLIAGLLMATAPLHIYYSQEARMYSMATFFVIVAFYFYTRLTKNKSPLFAFGLGLSLSAALLTEYMTILFFPVVAILWIINKKLRKDFRLILISSVPILISAVVISQLFVRQLTNALEVKSSGSLWWNILGTLSAKNIALIPVKFTIGRISFENDLQYLFVASAIILFVAFLLIKAIPHKSSRTLILWLFLPVTLAIAISPFVSILYYFRLLFALPAMYLLIALGITRLKEKYFIAALVGMLTINTVTSAIYLFDEKNHREDWRSLVRHIAVNSPPSQVVFVANSQMEGFDFYNNSLERIGPEQIDYKSDKIWLLRYVQDIFDPSDTVRGEIEQAGFSKIDEHNFNGIIVWEYENRN